MTTKSSQIAQREYCSASERARAAAVAEAIEDWYTSSDGPPIPEDELRALKDAVSRACQGASAAAVAAEAAALREELQFYADEENWDVGSSGGSNILYDQGQRARNALSVPSPAVAALEQRLALLEPMPCGHPGACADNAGYCKWCMEATALVAELERAASKITAQRLRAEALAALVPEARLLKRLASQAHHDYVWAKDEPPAQMAIDIDEARALAARIKEAQGQGQEAE